MREIKFRGIDRKTGEFVYGDLITAQDGDYPTIKSGFADYHEVRHESIRQYCAKDAQGRDLYEGDRVLLEHKLLPVPKEFEVRLTVNGLAQDGCWLNADQLSRQKKID